MLKIDKINAGYGKIRVLKNVSIRIEKGEIITLIGANGAGKTTTLMAISSMVKVNSGSITFMGKKIHNTSPNNAAAMGICQVPEGRHIFPLLSVSENLDMGAFLRKDKKNLKKDMDYIFSLFPILEERRHQAGGTLSGGEQQMLAISRAIMARPKLLLLDEPSLGLAPIIVKRIFDIIKKINKESGTTIFLVEQNANLALKVANRGYVMENGSIAVRGKASELLENDTVKKAYLGL